tara:strand:+ start:65 stop:2332 length:2268 start_codon:yes stop_codon:yes gene_type:complete
MAKTTVDTLLVKIEADLGSLKKELGKVNKQTKHFSNDFKKNFQSMGRSTLALSRNLALVGGAVGVAFGAVAVKKVVNVGMEIEGLQVRLKNLFGGAKAGKEAFDELAKFASKVPFSLQEIQQGAGSLAVVANDAEHLSRLLTITGNAAALTGLDFATASGQIQRAFAGGAAASDLFRERGLNALLGFKAGATVTAEDTAKIFEDNLGANGKFGKTTDELAETLSGTLSMIGDKVFNFQRLIADEKFFGTLKTQFENLNEHLESNQEALDKLANAIGIGLANAVEKSVDILVDMSDNLEEVKLAIQAIGALAVVAIFGKITTAVVAVTFALIEAIKKLHQFNEFVGEKLGLRPERVKQREAEIKQELLNRAEGANLSTGGSPDFSRAGQIGEIKTPVSPKMRPDIAGLEDEELIKQIKLLDDKARVLKITNETEREFEELLIKTGIQSAENTERLRVRFEAIKELEKAEVNRLKLLEEEKDAEEELDKKRKKALDIIDSYKSEQVLLNEKISEFKTLMGTLTTEEMPTALETLQKMEDDLRGLNPTVKILEENFDRAFDGIAQSIADSMTEGKNAMESFKDVARNILNSLIRDFVRFQLEAIKVRPYNNSGGGSFLGSIFGGFGSLFGGYSASSFQGISASGTTNVPMSARTGPAFGGLAGGGRIAPDMPTLVGERGAELFVPNTSGKIVPKSGISNALGGSSTIVNQTINVSAGVAQTIRAEMMNMLPSFKQETIAAVAESRLRGGEFASAFTGA